MALWTGIILGFWKGEVLQIPEIPTTINSEVFTTQPSFAKGFRLINVNLSCTGL